MNKLLILIVVALITGGVSYHFKIYPWITAIVLLWSCLFFNWLKFKKDSLIVAVIMQNGQKFAWLSIFLTCLILAYIGYYYIILTKMVKYL